MPTIEMTEDQLNKIVVDELKDAYSMCAEDGYEKLCKAINRVLKYYMISSEYREWHEENVDSY